MVRITQAKCLDCPEMFDCSEGSRITVCGNCLKKRQDKTLNDIKQRGQRACVKLAQNIPSLIKQLRDEIEMRGLRYAAIHGLHEANVMGSSEFKREVTYWTIFAEMAELKRDSDGRPAEPSSQT